MQTNPVLWIDSAIIGFVERFAHWFQKLTGKTNFFLVGVVNWVLLVPFFISLIRRTSILNPFSIQPIEKGPYEYIVLFFLMCVFLEKAMFGWKTEEDEAWERLANGLANPAKNSFIASLVRVFEFPALILFTFTEISLICLIILSLFPLGHYLSSCDPLPPCQGKIKEWLGSLFGKHATEPG